LTPLFTAVQTGSPEVVEFLIKNKANVNAKDSEGNTPAHIAASAGNEKMVALLQKNGAGLKIKNNDGKTVKDLLAAAKAQVGNQGGNATIPQMKKVAKVKKTLKAIDEKTKKRIDEALKRHAKRTKK